VCVSECIIFQTCLSAFTIPENA